MPNLKSNWADADTSTSQHAQAHNDLAKVANRLDYSAGSPLMYLPGQWITGQDFSSVTMSQTSPYGARIIFVPIEIRRTVSLDRLGFWLVVAGAAGNVTRLGMYNSSPTTGKPTTVLVDGGTVAIDTGAGTARTVTISATVDPGLYWFACHSTAGTTATIRYFSAGARDIAGFTTWSASPASVTGCWVDPLQAPTSALPNVSAMTLTADMNNVAYLIAARVA